jgi:hypothetical protein
MRLGLGAAALLAACLLAACSEEPSRDAGATVSPTPSDAPLTDPIAFESSGHGCVADGGTYLLYERFTTDEALTLTGVDLLAPLRTRITGSWISTPPADAVPAAGLVLGTRPLPRDRADVGWPTRQPLAGSTLQPGTPYQVLLRLELDVTGSYEAIDFDWTGESGEGTSRFKDRLEVGEGCA